MSHSVRRPRTSRRYERTRPALAVLVTAAVLALTACSGDGGSTPGTVGDGPTEPTPVAIQLGWLPNVENMAAVVALENGYFADEGLDVTILPGGPDVTADAQVAGGNALLGVLSAEALANSVAAGSGLVAMAATYQTTSSAIVTLADSGIAEPADLVGHTLGMSQTDAPVYGPFFDHVGIDFEQIEPVMVGSDPAALASGEVDAITGTLPNQPVALRAQGLDIVTIPLADYGYNRWSGLFVTRADVLTDETQRAQVVAMVRALRHGLEDAVADPAGAAQIVVDRYGQDLGLDLETQAAGAEIWADLAQAGAGERGLLYVEDDALAGLQEFFDTVGIEQRATDLFDLSVQDEALT